MRAVSTLGDVQGDLAMLFEKQYTLTQTIETETRYRTETRTDSEGNPYTVEVPYTTTSCNVKLENFDLSHPACLHHGRGSNRACMRCICTRWANRPDLFPTGTYPNASTVKDPTYYDIPPESFGGRHLCRNDGRGGKVYRLSLCVGRQLSQHQL